VANYYDDDNVSSGCVQGVITGIFLRNSGRFVRRTYSSVAHTCFSLFLTDYGYVFSALLECLHLSLGTENIIGLP
jgi:hypothetical protein